MSFLLNKSNPKNITKNGEHFNNRGKKKRTFEI